MDVTVVISGATLIAVLFGLLKVSSRFGRLEGAIEAHAQAIREHETSDASQFLSLKREIDDNRRYYESQLTSINGSLRELIGAFNARRREHSSYGDNDGG